MRDSNLCLIFIQKHQKGDIYMGQHAVGFIKEFKM